VCVCATVMCVTGHFVLWMLLYMGTETDIMIWLCFCLAVLLLPYLRDSSRILLLWLQVIIFVQYHNIKLIPEPSTIIATSDLQSMSTRGYDPCNKPIVAS